jgi:hypothetical protein
MTDPSPELPPVPPFTRRLPRAVSSRIRVTATRARRHRTAAVPVICIFGAGAHLGDGRPWPDRPPR